MPNLNRTRVCLLLLVLVACNVTPTPSTPTPTPFISPITPTPFVSPLTPTPPVSPLMPVTATPFVSPVMPEQLGGTGRLINGGMELPYYYPNPNYGTIFAPGGWIIGWVNPPPCQVGHAGCYIACPSNCVLPNLACSNDSGCAWAQPETTRVLAAEYAGLRVRTGEAAAKSFVVGRMGEWWYQQSVGVPVTVASPITFSAYLQAWQCFDFSQCSKGQRSDKPTAMHLKVGIDPTGGTVITATSVVWSPEGDAHRIDKAAPDIWRLFTVSAVPKSRRVTVFISTRVDWSLPSADFPALYDGNYARMNNDLYIDDAKLELPDYPIVHLPMVRR